MSNQAIVNSLVDDKAKKVAELESVYRLVTNNINLLNDMEIKGAYAMPMAEVLNWLEAFKRSVKENLDSLKPVSEKAEEPKAIEAQVVS